ncbi:hypothetical protein SLEP1_g58516 [Rubroshorea leprosula]|uniref:Uncharacterized protein n=1 Tax=Rubroshorea leprosula TaxID=152421 RepID=A0AAV5MR22_9ROSI|nr:hypothetical protein SLEP1_g58516 [Rubroshorea leprosula]
MPNLWKACVWSKFPVMNSGMMLNSYWAHNSQVTTRSNKLGMMVTFLAPAPTLAAFAVSIVTSLWVSASRVVVVLSDIKFYK